MTGKTLSCSFNCYPLLNCFRLIIDNALLGQRVIRRTKINFMKPAEKCELLANEIKMILSEGINLGDDVVHYIDSTFSNPTNDELKAILDDDAN